MILHRQKKPTDAEEQAAHFHHVSSRALLGLIAFLLLLIFLHSHGWAQNIPPARLQGWNANTVAWQNILTDGSGNLNVNCVSGCSGGGGGGTVDQGTPGSATTPWWMAIGDGAGTGYAATVFDINNANPVTDMLAVAPYDGNGNGPPTNVVPSGPGSGPNIAQSVILTGGPTSGTEHGQALSLTDDGSGNLNVNLQVAHGQIDVYPGVYTQQPFGTYPPGSGVVDYLQTDNAESLFVKPFRRSQTLSQATTISSSSAAHTILAAQVSGPGSPLFTDLTQLTITCTAQATGVAFTATLSDGTNSFIYDLNTGSTTSLVIAPPFMEQFNPALPATNSNTAWTLTLSSSSVTCHVTVVAVLQDVS